MSMACLEELYKVGQFVNMVHFCDPPIDNTLVIPTICDYNIHQKSSKDQRFLTPFNKEQQ